MDNITDKNWIGNYLGAGEKKLANTNYGNKVQVRDSQGRVTGGGLSFGTYKEIGMAVYYENKDEAGQVAGILREENPK